MPRRKKNNIKIRHLATGVDTNYLHKAVAFYESLGEVHDSFVLHIFCFDEIAYLCLQKLRLTSVVAYHPKSWETPELQEVKKTKERKYEYYWTCNPHMGRLALSKSKSDFIALADCDLFFYESPEVIFEELGKADVIIQSNNFSFPYGKDYPTIGYYCTSFQCFRNNINSKKILNWWYEKCLEWCSRKIEEGRFGEQKYLDDWRTRFKKVREVLNPGTNVAPWNIEKYDLSERNGRILINDRWPLVYYHFHSFRMNLDNYKYVITGDRNNNYKIPPPVVKLVYRPYATRLKKIIKRLKKIGEYREYVMSNPKGVQQGNPAYTPRSL